MKANLPQDLSTCLALIEVLNFFVFLLQEHFGQPFSWYPKTLP